MTKTWNLDTKDVNDLSKWMVEINRIKIQSSTVTHNQVLLREQVFKDTSKVFILTKEIPKESYIFYHVNMHYVMVGKLITNLGEETFVQNYHKKRIKTAREFWINFTEKEGFEQDCDMENRIREMIKYNMKNAVVSTKVFTIGRPFTNDYTVYKQESDCTPTWSAFVKGEYIKAEYGTYINRNDGPSFKIKRPLNLTLLK